jgi:hypothetical protein
MFVLKRQVNHRKTLIFYFRWKARGKQSKVKKGSHLRFSKMFRFSLVTTSMLLGIAAFANSGSDEASRYSPDPKSSTRWMNNGHRGDLVFGVWKNETISHGGSAGHFVGSSGEVAGDIDTGGKSFGIYASSPDPTAPASSSSTKKFAKPALTTGDRLSFKLTSKSRDSGSRGVSLRDASGTAIFNFEISNSGYHVNGNLCDSLDATPHPNSVFTLNFAQTPRTLEYQIHRPGETTATTNGSLPVDSGTISDAHFYISGSPFPRDTSHNFYFNQLRLSSSPRAKSPLTLGERRTPYSPPSHWLLFQDPLVTAVHLRHRGDNFTQAFPLSKESEDTWKLDVRGVLEGRGWHEFKFMINGRSEPGQNRWLYLNEQGKVAPPPTVYLTWQGSPLTTMTVGWYNDNFSQNKVIYRLEGSTHPWKTVSSDPRDFPHTGRVVHLAEITELSPDSTYEFKVDGYPEVFKFRTMPLSLQDRPIKIGIGGDVGIGPTADQMTASISAKDPDFLIIGGDHAYDDALASNYWKWERYMESLFRNARSPDGRLIPLVVTVGNHEVANGFSFSHPDFENTSDWRDRYAPYYYKTFPFPGSKIPYGVLDFANYLSLLLTDTEHTSPVITGSDPQTRWLASTLSLRQKVNHLLPIHHVPAYPSYRSFNDVTSSRIRNHWVPLYESSGVQSVFENHDHSLKISKPILAGAENDAGIRYFGDGLWGVSQRTPDNSRWYIQEASPTHHVYLVTLTPDCHLVESVGLDGDELLEPVHQKKPSPASVPARPFEEPLNNK